MQPLERKIAIFHGEAGSEDLDAHAIVAKLKLDSSIEQR